MRFTGWMRIGRAFTTCKHNQHTFRIYIVLALHLFRLTLTRLPSCAPKLSLQTLTDHNGHSAQHRQRTGLRIEVEQVRPGCAEAG